MAPLTVFSVWDGRSQGVFIQIAIGVLIHLGCDLLALAGPLVATAFERDVLLMEGVNIIESYKGTVVDVIEADRRTSGASRSWQDFVRVSSVVRIPLVGDTRNSETETWRTSLRIEMNLLPPFEQLSASRNVQMKSFAIGVGPEPSWRFSHRLRASSYVLPSFAVPKLSAQFPAQSSTWFGDVFWTLSLGGEVDIAVSDNFFIPLNVEYSYFPTATFNKFFVQSQSGDGAPTPGSFGGSLVRGRLGIGFTLGRAREAIRL